jgi:hypothetical protein
MERLTEALRLIQALLLTEGRIAARARLPQHSIQADQELVGAPPSARWSG